MTSIGHYLTDFSALAALSLPDEAGFPGEGASETDMALPGEEGADALEVAREEAFAAGSAASEAGFADRLAALEARHVEHLADERQAWAEAEGRVLADGIERGLAALETRLADALAAVLEPFLDLSLRAKAAGELRDAIDALLAHGTGAPIDVRGPGDLVEALRGAYQGKASVTVTADDSLEVTVTADETTIRSRLGAWATSLASLASEAS